jgi:hypothetical protein
MQASPSGESRLPQRTMTGRTWSRRARPSLRSYRSARNANATPPLMARRHSADRRHNDSTRTPASWTPRAPRAIEVRASAVARRRVPNPRNASGKRRQQETAARSARLSFRSSTRRKRQRSRRRSRVRRFDSYRGSHDNHAWCRKFESALHHQLGIPSHAGCRASGWRDPDSNRGHHDFQTDAPNTRTGPEAPANRLLSWLPVERVSVAQLARGCRPD